MSFLFSRPKEKAPKKPKTKEKEDAFDFLGAARKRQRALGVFTTNSSDTGGAFLGE